VRRDAGRIHLDAELIDTRTNKRIWTGRFDRDLKGVFALQSEVAQKIANRLGAQVSSVEKAAIEQPPTTDLVAYDAYLRAKDLINGNTFSPRAKEDLFQAVELLTHAVSRDPLFFNAYYELAAAHDKIYFLGFDHTKARLQLAETTIQSVRGQRPESGETHLALAHHLYWAYRDYDQAKAELAIASRSLPNESGIPLLTGYIDRRQGRWDESVEEMKRALELDPHNFSILQQISLTYQALRRYDEALSTLDSVLAIAPKDAASRVRRAWVAAESRADLKPLHATIETVLTEDPSASPVIVYRWLDLALRQRDPAAAERALGAMVSGGCYDENIPFPTSWCEGLVARLRGDEPAARDAFTRARNELVQTLSSEAGYAQGLCALGVVDAALGNKEQAIREGELAVKLTPASQSAIEGSVLTQYLAIIHAWTGDKDGAIERLAEAAKLPGSHVTYGYLRLHPLWDPLRGDPRFEAIVASLAPSP
jgi:tetratricopeptide (TPR) repeat protein